MFRTRRHRAKLAAAAFLADWRHPMFAEPGLFYETGDEAGGGGGGEGTPAPAESTAAESPAADASSPEGEWDDSSLDAAFNKAQGLDEPLPEPETTAPPVESDGQPTLEEADVNLVRRFHLDPEDFEAIKPERRAKVLENLRARAAHDDRMGPLLAELQRRQQQEPPASAAAAAAEPAAQADHWAALHDVTGGEDATKAFKAAVQAEVEARLAPLQQQTEQQATLQAFMEAYHIEKGFASAIAPDGVDLADEKVKAAVMDEARRIWRNERLADPTTPLPAFVQKFNFAHAIPRAVQTLYTKQIKTAQANKAVEQRRASLKGTPASASARNTPRLTDEDDRLDAAFEAMQSGGRDAAARVYHGSGR